MATGTDGEDLERIMLDRVHRLLKGSKRSLCILVTGRTGAGKSALVNSIIGEYVAEEGDSANRVTTEVTSYEKKIGDIVITVYDSPGLQDGVEDKEKYLKELKEKCSGVDLNLYCVRMTDGMRPTEKDAIMEISNTLGFDEFWRNTSIVLTFANEVRPPRSMRSISEVAHFSKRMLQWRFLLRRVLTEDSQITENVAEDLPIIPAGYSDEPSLPVPEYDYWLRELWIQCLGRTKDIAKPILLQINWRRLRYSEEMEKEGITKKKGFEQPLGIIPPNEEAPKRVKAYFQKLR